MSLSDTLREIDRLFHSAASAATSNKRTITAFTALATAATVHAQTSIYVDDSAPSGGDGWSWSTAHRDLQQALAFARNHLGGQPTIIKVAAGIYAPDQRTRDRRSTFTAVSGVVIEGGFAGFGAPNPDERDPNRFTTILTGDLARDDGPSFTNRSDNSFHVITMSAAVMDLDGVIIRGGNADESMYGLNGGGIYWRGNEYWPLLNQPTFTDCTFTDNSASGDGGAISAPYGQTTSLVRCKLILNRAATAGGAVHGALDARDSEFSNNAAATLGGAIAFSDFNTALWNCRFVANHAGTDGGALFADSYAVIDARDCEFSQNNSSGRGGAISITGMYSGPLVSLVRCHFTSNHSDTDGGAISVWGDGYVGAEDCQFVSNSAAAGGGAVNGELGMYAYGTAFHAIRGLFSANAAHDGGAVRGIAVLSACTLLDNTALGSGGGLFALGDSQQTVGGCLFAGNRAALGGAMFSADQAQYVDNSTFVANSAASGGAIAAAAQTGGPALTTCILWNNSATTGPQISVGDHAYVWLDRCDLAGGIPAIGRGASASVYNLGSIISLDPRFRNPLGPDGDPATTADNDYRLLAGSPCIDAGYCIPASKWVGSGVDLDGAPRFGPRPCIVTACSDLGAFEYQTEPCDDPSPAIFVRSDAPLGGDGRSWNSAFRDIQAAVDSTRDRPIWIAGGVYRPDTGIIVRPPLNASGLRRTIVGGFAGTESDPAQRDPGAQPTMISADRLGDDAPDGANRTDNLGELFSTQQVAIVLEDLTFRGVQLSTDSRIALNFNGVEHITRVRIEDCRATRGLLVEFFGAQNSDGSVNTVPVDGLVVSGCVGGSGRTVRFNDWEWQLSDCIFENNTNTGGNIVFDNSAGISIRRTRFSGNQSNLPTLRLDHGRTVIIADSRFLSNTRTGSTALGGAVYCVTGGGVAIARSTFIGNSAVTTTNTVALGAAIYTTRYLDLSDSLLVANSVSGRTGAGGAAVYAAGDLHLTNCTIAGNRSSTLNGSQWGAVRAAGARGIATSSILWGNQRGDGVTGQDAQITVEPPTSGAPLTVRRSLIDGYVLLPGATDVFAGDPLFMDPLGADGAAGTGDEDYRLAPGSPAIDRADGAAAPTGDRAPDFTDANANLDPDEPTPFDLSGNPRLLRAAGSPATSTLLLDLGAFEFQQTVCAADWNGRGGLSLQDLFDFLTAYFRNQADFNRSGATDVGDIFDFLAAYFAGCP